MIWGMTVDQGRSWVAEQRDDHFPSHSVFRSQVTAHVEITINTFFTLATATHTHTNILQWWRKEVSLRISTGNKKYCFQFHQGTAGNKSVNHQAPYTNI